MLTVKLSNLPANAPWGVNALISYQADSVTVHYDDAFSFRCIQQGGRQLQAQGVEAVSLSGDGWSYERQWAFYCGFAEIGRAHV